MQPPFQINLVDETDEIEEIEIEYPDQDVDHLDAGIYSIFVTRSDYHDAMTYDYDIEGNFEQNVSIYSCTMNVC